MRRLLLLRHGRTEWNAVKRVQGQTDVGLDEVGRAQAARVAPVLACLGPTLLWASDLARASQTASYVATATGLPLVLDPRLREYHLGVREGFTHEEYLAAAPEEYAEFRRGNFDVCPGGERAEQVGERMTACLTSMFDALPADGIGVAVTHGAAARVATAGLMGLPPGCFHTFTGLDNCGWVELTESPWVSTLKLVAYNRAAPETGLEPHTPVG